MITNALTVDVEDYFQVSAFSKNISVEEWKYIPTRVEMNTDKLLDIFNDNNYKATFFILGWIAEKYPELVKRIANEGHEVASHGYSHQLIYDQTRKKFEEETYRSKSVLEDIIQKSVIGYRAASYSITSKSVWAIDILSKHGFVYDSSIYPIHHDRYGMPGSPTCPHIIKTSSGREIIEFPLTVIRILRQSVPISGGGYFRLYPYWLTKILLDKYLEKNDTPFIFYLHPWEIDPDQPRVKSNILGKFRHYNNLDKCEKRLTDLLSRYKFSTMNGVYDKDINSKNCLPVVEYNIFN